MLKTLQKFSPKTCCMVTGYSFGGLKILPNPRREKLIGFDYAAIIAEISALNKRAGVE